MFLWTLASRVDAAWKCCLSTSNRAYKSESHETMILDGVSKRDRWTIQKALLSCLHGFSPQCTYVRSPGTDESSEWGNNHTSLFRFNFSLSSHHISDRIFLSVWWSFASLHHQKNRVRTRNHYATDLWCAIFSAVHERQVVTVNPWYIAFLLNVSQALCDVQNICSVERCVFSITNFVMEPEVLCSWQNHRLCIWFSIVKE